MYTSKSFTITLGITRNMGDYNSARAEWSETFEVEGDEDAPGDREQALLDVKALLAKALATAKTVR